MKTHFKIQRTFFSAARTSVCAMFLIGITAIGADAQTNTFPTTGNAGSGTTSPSDALHIVKDNGGLTLDTATSGTIVPVFRFNTTGTGRASIQYRPDLPGLAFQTGGISYPTQNRMVLTDSGLLGIGTSNVSPWTQQTSVIESLDTSIFFGLDTDIGINSNAYHQSGWKYKTSDAASNIHMYKGEFYFRQAPAGTAGASLTWTTPMFINSAGNIGIGTTNTQWARLSVNKSIRIDDDSGSATGSDTMIAAPFLYLGTTAAGNLFQFNGGGGLDLWQYNSGWSRTVTFAKTGNVGIGTTSPASKLEVAGVIHSNTGGFKFPDGSVQQTAATGGGGGSVTSVFGRTGAVVAATNDYTWAQINKSAANAGDLAAGTLLAARMPALTGDVTTSVGTVATTLSNTGVSAGSYTSANITVDAKGRITAASNGSGGSTAFSGITAGTNTVALVVGNSGSLGVSGTGTINATSLSNAANITSGTVPTARLGTGTANNTTFLRGDNTWAALTSSQWTTNGSSINYAPAGNVGIGVTGTPAEKLHVVGNGKITGNLTVDGTINAKYQDLAEWVPSSEQLSAGTVVVLDTTKSNQVISSTASYDTRVAGVISAQPGITLGEGGEGKVLVATTGRVRVKVDASRGPIQIGDLLVTSDVLGVAMKSEPVNLGGVQIHRPGTIIGKALEPLAKGSGEILVLLSLQ